MFEKVALSADSPDLGDSQWQLWQLWIIWQRGSPSTSRSKCCLDSWLKVWLTLCDHRLPILMGKWHSLPRLVANLREPDWLTDTAL